MAIPRSVSLAIISAAAEVFPKECMGCICCDEFNKVVVAFPYQLAKRRDQEVSSDSSFNFDKLFQTGPFVKMGDFHSHTFQSFEKIPTLGPSSVDLEELPIGGIEVIVQIKRARRKYNSWKNTENGISISWERFRFLIGAFMRVEGIDSDGVPLYKKIRIMDGARHRRKRR